MTAPSPLPEHLLHLTTAQLIAVLQDILAGAGDVILTTKEAAEFMQISENQVREMATAGTLPHGRIGKEYRFSRAALLAHSKGAST